VRGQLGLFAEPGVGSSIDDGERALARELPAWIRLGTSSWTFPGWSNLVYAGRPSEKDLKSSGLRAYAEHPLFRTVSIDRAYYGPLSSRDLAGYAAQLPAGFLAVSKVWDEITTFVFPNHPRAGERAGKKNPFFLDPAKTRDEVLAFYTYEFMPFTGPFVFELPPAPPDMVGDGREHFAAIERLLRALPTNFRYAFELRNRELLVPRYFDLLREYGASHVYNMWTAMPSVGEQLAMSKPTAPFAVARLMLPARTRYAQLKDAYAPFDRIVLPQPEMREDVARLALACEESSSELFVLANNKAEGCAPLTLRAVAETIIAWRSAPSPNRRP
jgi:uncharacterized protein YecE (DUF72 family)